MHPLIFVSTPIGNLSDLSFRALDAMKRADVIICEDTRHSRKLLNHYSIHAELLSFHNHSGTGRISYILQILQSGKRCVYISDAGTPMISDPGYELVQALTNAGLPYDVIPGANAVLPALLLSGLPVEPFLFLGFLPRKETEIRTTLTSYMDIPATLLAYQSPRRIRRTLIVLSADWPDREVAVVKEITKVHQTVVRGLPEELLQRFSEAEKGEFVLVIAPPDRAGDEVSDTLLRTEYRMLIACDIPGKQAVRFLARKYSINGKLLYRKSLDW